MEVNKDNFKEHLLPILRHIADSSYVTFDLEMSGISTRPRYSPGDRSHDIGKPSLQQQYDDIRAAAETFQILQVGITCVEEDRDREYYLARPYNFFLSPLSAGGVDVKLERTFSFSSSACDFLKGNGFDFGKVFASGVPYLSQSEEHDLREEFRLRADKNTKIPDVVVPLDDPSTLGFYRAARTTITAWTKEEKPEYPYVNISRPDGALNGFQRRLIYQLIRSEFPKLRVFGRNGGDFMQVEKLDEKKEADFQKRALDKFNTQIAKQKGFRWIFEALSGGSLEGINPSWFCDPNSEDADTELLLRKKELAGIAQKLKNKDLIIVGHNLFTDLAFFYKTFVGKLPRTVKHFQEDVHELFPTVFDTKFLATHGDGQMQLRTNLKELLTPFKKIHTPLIVLHEKHTSYGSAHGKEHEAGFDSWMTAELFIKLSVKMYEARKSALPLSSRDSDTEDSPTTPLENLFSDTSSQSSDPSSGGVSLHPPPKPKVLKPIDYSLPIEYIAKQMNLNSNAFSSKDRQWMPKLESAFWDELVNKLRVNASDKGVCDLEDVDDDYPGIQSPR